MFMIREQEGLEGLSEEVKHDYVDTDEDCIEKVKVLKAMIQTTFPVCFFCVMVA